MRIIDALVRIYNRHEGLAWLEETAVWKRLYAVYGFFVMIPNLRFLKNRSGEKKTVFIMVHALTNGGAERVSAVLASELSKRYHIVLLTRYERGEHVESYRIPKQLDRIFLPIPHSEDFQNEGYAVRCVRRLKKAQNACASISLLYEMNALNVASRANDAVICCERNNPEKSLDSDRIEEIRQLYEKADHVVFQSEIVRNLFSDSIKAHSTILPNPVGVTCLRKAVTGHRIVTCGRLTEQKNHAMLIRAFSEFHLRHPEYTLSIYGKGKLWDELEQLIDELDLRGCVKLEGRSSTIHEDISDAEIFVLSSDYEGLSNALLEAMMMGFPCITTDCEGSTDVIVNGENGLMIHRGSQQELTQALLRYAEDPDFREKMGLGAKATAQSFRKEAVAEKWSELIERV